MGFCYSFCFNVMGYEYEHYDNEGLWIVPSEETIYLSYGPVILLRFPLLSESIHIGGVSDASLH
jgi:hypothetical protein